MNYTAKQYSQALLECSKKADYKEIDGIIACLETLLKKQGKRSFMSSIIQQLQDSYDTSQGITHVKVTSSSQASISEKDIEKTISTLSKEKPHITIEHDTAIIAGVRVLVDSQWHIDTTTNNSLKKLSDQLHTI